VVWLKAHGVGLGQIHGLLERSFSLVGLVDGDVYTWAWAARPGRPDPGKKSLSGPGLHVGPGSGLDLEPGRRDGLGLVENIVLA
jgi:hypothetical protein